ncbi:ABC transporter ATP-binding protein [Protaetiibacter mangrovi]|uniref:ABC transporter ATP-binding protein n=1 Tax=Protaetiibacter mangrovi TaxID=2970926 RepID=A0ABT1ZFS7_9MICO|nr:ABC transporter ATP-binding protein [Protaetiibacter mangrovi]MCS0499552.1 ABC transporter ATP-binding protein [Protaetiibacter mangrovi]TPX04572.1 ABC transporter ATP-binding protein [Schumannella luteola]
MSVADTGAPAPAARLSVRDVTARFGGITALEDVSFDVAPGEVVGLIGPNGAGKTTMFNIICGLAKAKSGTVLVDGEPRPRADRLAAAGVARTFQGLALFSGLTVRQNVMAGLSPLAPGALTGLIGLKAGPRHLEDAARRAQSALDGLGIGDTADRLPDDLPYPLQKRVALARALVSSPRLLLLDEPAGGLGEDEIDELGELILDVVRENAETSVLFVEHHVDLVMAVSDRIVVLDAGRVIAAGTPERIRVDPVVAEAYLGQDVDVDDIQGVGR